MHMGTDFILANTRVDYTDAIDSRQVEADIAAINLAIEQKFPETKRDFVETGKRGNRNPPDWQQGNG